MRLRWARLAGGCLFLAVGFGLAYAGDAAEAGWTSRANTPPRKVVAAAALAGFSGSVEQRLGLAAELLERTAREAGTTRRLDLMVFPEFALCREEGVTAADRAVPLAGPVLGALGAMARAHRAWLVMPMTLREADRVSNAAVLIDRSGRCAGIYRKVHPVADERGELEGGVAPGDAYPVFDCDFGRLGILICWDMGYEAAWAALAAGGAEIVALPSASPQTLRPMAEALRHRCHVVTSTPRDNATVIDPIGRPVAQVTTSPGVVVQQIDLAFAILHWSENLREGRALTERFGDRVGGSYSTREDTGVFWSNDPQTSIGEMIRAMGLREMPDEIARMEAAARRHRPTVR